MNQRPFFAVGDTVQLRPKERYFCDRLSCFWEQNATIKRIQLCPDPNIYVDPQDWYRGPHWTQFWVETDLPELQGQEIPFRYRDLRPLSRTSHA